MNAHATSLPVNPDAFGWIITAYFFFAAVAAGLFLFAAVVHLFNLSRWRSLARVATLLTPVVVAALGLTLILELAQPARFFRVMLHFNPTSPISWGAWIINLFGVLTVLYAWAELKGLNWQRPLAIVGVPLAGALPVYTAFELLMTRGSPLWTSALMPVLFLLSAGIVGIGSLLLISAIRGEAADNTFLLGRLVSHLLLYVLVLVGFQMAVLFSRSNEAAYIGRSIFNGEYSGAFWLVFVLLGTVAPIAILYHPQVSKDRLNQALAGLFILVGTFSLRAIEIFAGQNFPAH